jgi:predicted adenine nucleotide alpha hydrolase (AANH) superfamily ATPase
VQATRLFLSYSVKDRELAGEVKQRLSGAGFDVFLAHEDIKPTDEWLRRIETELKRCHVFIAILSGNFRNSEWTDQEAGYALSRCRTSRKRCLILSLVVSPMPLRPHGFLKDFQALKLDRERVEDSCKSVARTIDEKLGLAAFRKNHAISQFALSRSFAQAKQNLRALRELAPFSLAQAKQIAQATLSNTQIYWPEENHREVRRLLHDHFDELDKETRSRLSALSHW